MYIYGFLTCTYVTTYIIEEHIYNLCTFTKEKYEKLHIYYIIISTETPGRMSIYLVPLHMYIKGE